MNLEFWGIRTPSLLATTLVTESAQVCSFLLSIVSRYRKQLLLIVIVLAIEFYFLVVLLPLPYL